MPTVYWPAVEGIFVRLSTTSVFLLVLLMYAVLAFCGFTLKECNKKNKERKSACNDLFYLWAEYGLHGSGTSRNANFLYQSGQETIMVYQFFRKKKIKKRKAEMFPLSRESLFLRNPVKGNFIRSWIVSFLGRKTILCFFDIKGSLHWCAAQPRGKPLDCRGQTLQK